MGNEILVVGATSMELEGLVTSLGGSISTSDRLTTLTWQATKIYVLCTGIGIANTAYSLGRFLASNSVDWALQIGIGGAFTDNIELGSVVEIREECYGDLGAESPSGFLTLEDMGFANFQLNGKAVYNSFSNPSAGRSGLRTCKGITVNKVHGIEGSIAQAKQTWQPEVESMEGAAFMQICLSEGIPCTEIRGISNRVETRNRSSWKIPEAIKAAQTAGLEFLKQFDSTNHQE